MYGATGNRTLPVELENRLTSRPHANDVVPDTKANARPFPRVPWVYYFYYKDSQMTETQIALASGETKTMRLIDLTGPFEEGMWRYGPEFPPYSLEAATSIEENGFAVQKVTISTHMGTHFDPPGHLIAGSDLADTIALDLFAGPAAILRLGPVDPLEAVSREKFEAAAGALRPGDIAVVETGWSTRLYDDNFVTETPHLTMEAAHWLVERKIKCFAWDAPMFMDPRLLTADMKPGSEPVEIPDAIVLEANIPMIAPVQNLAEISADRFWFTGFPMKIKDGDGAPTRCVAMEGVIDV